MGRLEKPPDLTHIAHNGAESRGELYFGDYVAVGSFFALTLPLNASFFTDPINEAFRGVI